MKSLPYVNVLFLMTFMSLAPNFSTKGGDLAASQSLSPESLYFPNRRKATTDWRGVVSRPEAGALLQVADFWPEEQLLRDRDDVPDRDKIGMICSKIDMTNIVKEKLGVTSGSDDENHIDQIICGTANFVSPCELVTSYHVPLREIPLNMWKQGSVSAYFAVGWGKFHPGSKLGSGPDFEHHTELALIDASMYISAADPDHSPEIDRSNDCAYFKLKNCIEGDPEHSFSDYFRMTPLAPADLVGLRCQSAGFTRYSKSQLLYDRACGFPPPVVGVKGYGNGGVQNICSSNKATSGAAIQCDVSGQIGIVAIQSGGVSDQYVLSDSRVGEVTDRTLLSRNKSDVLNRNFRNLAAPISNCPADTTKIIVQKYIRKN